MKICAFPKNCNIRLSSKAGLRSRALKQGCGVGVTDGVGVGQGRPFCLESESELEPIKFCRFRLRPEVAGYQPSTDNDFGRTVMHRPENIEGQKEKERDSVGIKLKHNMVKELRLIKRIRNHFEVIVTVV